MLDVICELTWSLFFVLLGLVAIGAVLGGAGMLAAAAWKECKKSKDVTDSFDDGVDEFDITTSSLVDLARRSDDLRFAERYRALRRHSYVDRSDPGNPRIYYGPGYIQERPQDLDEEMDRLINNLYTSGLVNAMIEAED